MLSRIQITFSLALAVAIWTLVLIVHDIPVTRALLIPFGVTVSVLTLLAIGFDLRGWRFWCFKGWLVKRPWLQGTWKVELQSSWIDPQTNQQIGPISCFMTIKQTFSSLTLRLHTMESSSVSLSSSILMSEDGVFRVAATYQNDPNNGLRGVRSEIHYGALTLTVHDDPVSSLSGNYWTDRKTTGTLKLTSRHNQLASNYSAAQELFVKA